MKITKYTFFSMTHRSLSKTDNILHKKTSVSFKLGKIRLFFGHNGIKLKINCGKISENCPYIWK